MTTLKSKNSTLKLINRVFNLIFIRLIKVLVNVFKTRLNEKQIRSISTCVDTRSIRVDSTSVYFVQVLLTLQICLDKWFRISSLQVIDVVEVWLWSN